MLLILITMLVWVTSWWTTHFFCAWGGGLWGTWVVLPPVTSHEIFVLLLNLTEEVLDSKIHSRPFLLISLSPPMKLGTNSASYLRRSAPELTFLWFPLPVLSLPTMTFASLFLHLALWLPFAALPLISLLYFVFFLSLHSVLQPLYLHGCVTQCMLMEQPCSWKSVEEIQVPRWPPCQCLLSSLPAFLSVTKPFSPSKIQSPCYLDPSTPPPSCFVNCMHRRWRWHPHHSTHLLTPPARNPNLTLDDYSLLPTLFQQPAPADSSSSASGGYVCSSPRRQNRLLPRYYLPDGLPASVIPALQLIRMQKLFWSPTYTTPFTSCHSSVPLKRLPVAAGIRFKSPVQCKWLSYIQDMVSHTSQAVH